MALEKLTDDEFIDVISKTPLVSIDLVIRDAENRILMGRRINEPAMGEWFVPGGRVFKDESLDKAFERISLNEIGLKICQSEARLLGLFTHKYNTNFKGVAGVTTHYVVLAYEINLSEIGDKYSKQHSEFFWFGKDDITSDIHPYSLEYFKYLSRVNKEQYGLLNSRRDSFNNLLWQTPVLSLTAQAFLFSIILSASTTTTARLFAAAISIATALASVQLLTKHRIMEAEHARMLHNYEEDFGLFAVNKKPIFKTWYTRLSSYWVWVSVLWGFAVAAALSTVLLP